MRIVVTSLASILLGSLLGCGLKGPLYLPEPAKQVEPPPKEQNSAESNSTEQDAQKKKPPQPAPSTTR